MTNEEALALLGECGAYEKGHFQLKGDRHTDTFLQCAHLTEYAAPTEKLCRELADRCRGCGATLVVAPALGGLIYGYEVSRQMGLRFIYAERKDGVMTFRRDFALAPEEKVLVVEDVVTTGGSIHEVIEIIRALGGQVVQVAALVDRSGGRAAFGVPFLALAQTQVNVWDAAGCPLCTQGLPVTRPRGVR